MPGGIAVPVELKCHEFRLALWQFLADAFGVRSIAARFVWWFLQPLVVNVAGRGWKPVEVLEWFEGKV